MGNFSENTKRVEYYEMAEKERLIGKQICIVGMLCPDEDSLLRELFFMDNLANWLKISEEELKRIIEGCNQFDDDEICLDAAMDYYVEFYLKKINDLYEEGFALAVIAEMTRNVLDEDEIRRLMRRKGYLI